MALVELVNEASKNIRELECPFELIRNWEPSVLQLDKLSIRFGHFFSEGWFY